MNTLPILLFPLLLTPSLGQLDGNSLEDGLQSCPDENVSFEMVTGYVYTAPADMLDSQPGTLMLTDCIDTCR